MREYQYDPLQRIKTIADRGPAGNTVMHYAYTHDAMDNITQKVTEHGIYGYDYDDLYRLMDVTNPAAVGANEAYTYDAVGNRITSADVTGDWQYNDNNELQSHGDVTYNYDDNGSMIEKSVGGVVTRFFYNLENRLERVEDGGGSVIAAYYYDPFGRRLWKDVGGTRTHFHYSDEGLVGEYDNSGNEIKTYGYKPGSTWTTDPVFMKVGVDYYFYHNDHLGTPQRMTGVNGAVVWGARYDSFGKAMVYTETVTNNLRFAGQYFDSETQLHYNYHRYYYPKIGRYLRSDPSHQMAKGRGILYLIPFLLDTPQELNNYNYSQSSPITNVDYFGLKRVKGFETKLAVYQIYYINFIMPESDLPSDPGYDPYDDNLPDPFVTEKVYYIEVPEEYVLLDITKEHYTHKQFHWTYAEVSHLYITFYWWGCPN